MTPLAIVFTLLFGYSLIIRFKLRSLQESAAWHKTDHTYCDEVWDKYCQAGNEISKLKAAIQKHRAATGQNLCYENDEELWEALDDDIKLDHTRPPLPEFAKGCFEYLQTQSGIQACDLPGKMERCMVYYLSRKASSEAPNA